MVSPDRRAAAAGAILRVMLYMLVVAKNWSQGQGSPPRAVSPLFESLGITRPRKTWTPTDRCILRGGFKRGLSPIDLLPMRPHLSRAPGARADYDVGAGGCSGGGSRMPFGFGGWRIPGEMGEYWRPCDSKTRETILPKMRGATHRIRKPYRRFSRTTGTAPHGILGNWHARSIE